MFGGGNRDLYDDGSGYGGGGGGGAGGAGVGPGGTGGAFNQGGVLLYSCAIFLLRRIIKKCSFLIRLLRRPVPSPRLQALARRRGHRGRRHRRDRPLRGHRRARPGQRDPVPARVPALQPGQPKEHSVLPVG